MQIAYEILRHLSDGKFHSGTMLAQSLRVSRSSIWKGIDFLRQLEVDVQAVSGRGYRWHEPPELLNKNLIWEELSTLAKENIARIEVVPIIGSTNDYLISRIPLGLAKGTVCLSEAQTAGRGRMGKSWQSPFGANIYLSLYWQFGSPLHALSGLSLSVAIAVLEALKTITPLPKEIGIKWPNDILYKQAKLAGILVETGMQQSDPCLTKEKLTHVVIGIGMNVNLPPTVAHSDWTDLTRALGKRLSRNNIIARLLEKLTAALTLFEREGFQAFQFLWQPYDLLAGKNVFLTAATGQEGGQVKGINDRGELLVQVGEGLKAIRYGEVSVRPEEQTEN